MFGISIGSFLRDVDSNRLSITDTRLRSVVRLRFREYAKMAVVCILLIWTALSLFYGAIHKRSVLVKNINLYIIDLDGGNVGSNITKMVLESESTPSQPNWLQSHHNLHSLDDAKSWVLQNAWGALVINKGLSQSLHNALNYGMDYNATDALTILESSGRHVITEMRFVQSALRNKALNITRFYAMRQLSQIKVSSIYPHANYMAMVHPISFTTVDVSPAGFSLAPVMSTLGYLLILLSMVSLLLIIKLTLSSLFLKVRYRDLAIMWPTVIFAYALVFSLYLALAFLAFRGPNYNTVALPYTAATFFKLWFTGTLVAFSLGLWIFNWYLYLPPRLLACASVTTVITNVASCIIPPELAPSFYHIIYALPFFNGSCITLYVTTGAHATVGRNVAVLVAEIAAMFFLLLLSIWVCQVRVLRGIVDATGWRRGSIFFSSPIPYYKSKNSGNRIHENIQDTEQTTSKHQSHFTNNISMPTRDTTIYDRSDCRSSSHIEIIDDNRASINFTQGNFGV